jgi:type VI secretion system ImpM family protein
MLAAGLFGKMPSAGDFVNRGLSPTMCDRLDHLLQAALMGATSDGADRRQVLSQSMPVMLSIRPGALCDSGFSGLWYPSCDRVGRVFPICVGLETNSEERRLPLSWPSPYLTRILCQTVATALQQGDGPEGLLARLPTPDDWVRFSLEGMPFGDVSEETVPTVSVDDDSFCLEGPESRMSVSSRALCSRLPWVVDVLGSIVGPDGNPDVYFGSRSLLSWTNLAALFDRQWSHWGWVTIVADGK